MSQDDTPTVPETSPPNGPETIKFPTDVAHVPHGTEAYSTLNIPVDGKVCAKCMKHLPRTAEFWHKNSHGEDGWHNECRECRTEALRKKRKASEEKLAMELSNLEDNAIDLLGDLRSTGANSEVPHESEVYEEIVAAMGGAAGFAKLWVANLLAAPAGSKPRTMALESFLKMAHRVSDSGAAQRVYDDMDHDALVNVLQQIIGKKLAESGAVEHLESDEDG